MRKKIIIPNFMYIYTSNCDQKKYMYCHIERDISQKDPIMRLNVAFVQKKKLLIGLKMIMVNK